MLQQYFIYRDRFWPNSTDRVLFTDVASSQVGVRFYKLLMVEYFVLYVPYFRGTPAKKEMMLVYAEVNTVSKNKTRCYKVKTQNFKHMELEIGQ